MVGERTMVTPCREPVFHRCHGFLGGLRGGVFCVHREDYQGHVRGRGSFGLFAQPRHTFAQYDGGESKGEGMTTEGGDAKTGRYDRQ